MLINMKKLSIITPVFNGESYIEQAITSVLRQGYDNFEHIVVDGGSTDGTVTILKRFPHLIWMSESDAGQSDAMNKGLRLAGGEIIGVLNADDYYEPGTFKKVVDFFRHLPRPSLLVGNCVIWHQDGTQLRTSRPNQISLDNLLMGRYWEAFPMNSSAYFYHLALHEVIGEYDVNDHYGMDLDFIFRALQSANVYYLDEVFGNYRYLPGTKTYEDELNGGNALRVKAITNRYREMQPVVVRARVWVKERANRIRQILKGLLSRTKKLSDQA